MDMDMYCDVYIVQAELRLASGATAATTSSVRRPLRVSPFVDLKQPVFAGTRGKMKLVLSENPATVEVRDRESTPRREAREQKESLAESAVANGFEPRQMPTAARDSARARAR